VIEKESVSADLDKLFQQSVHMRKRKPNEADLDAKLAQMERQVAESEPFINYIIINEGTEFT